MKKYVYAMLVVLCSPFLLDLHQVVAAEVENVVVEETLVASEEEVVTDSEDDLAPIVEEGSDEGDFTKPLEEEVKEEEAVEDEASVPEETVIAPDAVEDVVEAPAAVTPVAEDVAPLANPAPVSLVVDFVLADGTVISVDGFVGVEGETGYIEVPAGYVVTAISDPSFFSSYDAVTDTSRIYGTLSAALPALTVTVASATDSGILITFVDEMGDPIIGQSDVYIQGAANTQYNYDVPTLKGHTASHTNISGTFVAGDPLQIVTVTYTRVETSITFVYTEETGKYLSHEEVYTGKYGEDYEYTPATFFGLELFSINGQPFTANDVPFVGEFTDQDQVVTLVFRETSVIKTPVQYDPEPTPVVDLATNLTAELPQTETTTTVSLPNTGEKQQSSMALAAGAILIASGLAFFKKGKTVK